MLMLYAKWYSDSSQTSQIILCWCISRSYFWIHQVVPKRERKDTLVLKFPIKKFASFQAGYCLVGVISFQTVKCFVRRPLILLCKQGLIQWFDIRLSIVFGIFIFVTTKYLINKTNSRSSYPWLISQIGDFWSYLSTGSTNPSYGSLLRNLWQQATNKQQDDSRGI